MEFIANNMAPIMFAGLICFLLLGFPVAFSLGACGLFFAVIGIELGVLPEALLQALPLRIYGIMQNETMLAIPFFTLMGLILERSGMAEDLLDTVGQLFGPIRGGVAIAVILVGAMLAATTGVVAASVISMGLISLPIMMRYGYDRRIASGVIAASGTLAQIIPPSLVLIILADQLGRSVGDMYKGAFVPGFMLVGFYMLFIFLLAFFKPHMVPALPPEARSLKEKDGSSGLTSLLVLTVLCVAVSVFAAQNMPTIHTWFTGEVVEKVATDETIVFAMCFGVALAFVAASINRLTGMGLLSQVAEKVTFVLIPPLLLIFLVLGTIFLGIATHRRWCHGCHRCHGDGDCTPPPELDAAQAGTDVHHQAVVLCDVHPDRRDHVWPDLPGCGRPAVGGAPAGRSAWRPAGLPDPGEHHGVHPGVLPGLL